MAVDLVPPTPADPSRDAAPTTLGSSPAQHDTGPRAQHDTGPRAQHDAGSRAQHDTGPRAQHDAGGGAPAATGAAGVRGRAARGLPAAVLAVLLLAAWEIGVRALGVPAYLLPAPSAVALALAELRATLPTHALATVVTAAGGLVLAAVAGVALAIAIRTVPLVRRVLYPLLVVSQTIPMVVLAPLLVAWFGFGIGPKIAVVALVAFFPVVVSTVEGLDAAEPDLVDVAVSMGAGRAALLRHVLLPAALPGFFAGLSIAATYAMVGAVIAEWMGASSGLGLLITRSAASFRVDRVFAGVAVVAAVSIALFTAVRLLARLAMPWTAARTAVRTAVRTEAQR